MTTILFGVAIFTAVMLGLAHTIVAEGLHDQDYLDKYCVGFDKFLPWRQAAIHEVDDLVLLCPGEEFIADLPFGKIPDRSDFSHLEHDERVRYWQQCVQRSSALAEEFAEMIQRSDPLQGAIIFD